MNISFSQLGKHGRLGNQLFQVASTLGIAEKYKASASFPAWGYEGYFEIQLPHGELMTNRVEEKHFHHYDWDLQASCDLYGYMQSEKYFGSTRLKFKKALVAECKAKHEDLFKKKTICIQIRRGDYVGNENYLQLSVNYYIDALLSHFPKWRNYNILFTSDDIEYCRTHFECMPNAFFSVGNSDIEDMLLASCCDHFIISNSTFGWWCAWLGEKKHSKIIHCGNLHKGKLLENCDPKDYYPERWIRHEKDSYKIPLQDVTFTIPVALDHADRRKNFDLSTHLLRAAFETNFIIGEQGGTSFKYSSQWAKYIPFRLGTFHRTKMLNEMFKLSATKFVVNWDCDVIIPPMQILVAVEQLRNGADVVFPYDGRFGRMPRIPWYEKIQKQHDIGIVGDFQFKGRHVGHNSVGGAVMFNKESFIDGGMENENMVSFGPEDCERNDRFKLLGYDVRMTPGSLFHLNHFVGVNSSKANPYFAANHAELEKMRAMSREEMRAYVDTWPWRQKALRGEMATETIMTTIPKTKRNSLNPNCPVIVLGAVQGNSFETIETWWKSLQLAGFEGEIHMLVYEADQWAIDQLCEYGIQVHPGRLTNQVVIDRFRDAARLAGTLAEETWVIFTDVDDLVFQRDPAEFLAQVPQDKSIVVASEGVTFSGKAWARENLRKSFPEHWKQMAGELLYNAGSLAVRAGTLVRLGEEIYQMCARKPRARNHDQAALNILLREPRYQEKTLFTKVDGGWCFNAAPLFASAVDRKSYKDEFPSIDEGKCQFKNGLVPVMLHQYTRNVRVQQEVEERVSNG
jgi:hypothetical protein